MRLAPCILLALVGCVPAPREGRAVASAADYRPRDYAPRDPAPPDPAFEVAALDDVPLGDCVTPGYSMHVAVVFDARGTVRDVLVPPEAVGAEAATCIKQKLVAVRVPAFASGPVTLHRTVQGE
jgi:hypothetical protein